LSISYVAKAPVLHRLRGKRFQQPFNFNAKDDKKVERTNRCQQIRNYRDDSDGRIIGKVLILSQDHFEEMVIRIYVILLPCMPMKQKYHGKCGVRIELSGGVGCG
jgi:hypothetical protein